MDRRREIVITGGDVVTGHDPDTGRELWRVGGLNPRRNGNYRIVASPVVLDTMIFAPTRVRPLLALRVDGQTTVFRTGPTFQILGENPLEDYCLSSPAVSDGQIFIRTSRYLYAIGERRRPADE